MNQDDYIKSRVDPEIEWYDRRSVYHRRIFHSLSAIQIVAAASIPFMTGYISQTNGEVKFAVGLLGVLIAVLTAMVALFHFNDKWIQYRTTCEELKHEKYLFITNSPPYNTNRRVPLFVERIESIISEEHTSWRQYISEEAAKVDSNAS